MGKQQKTLTSCRTNIENKIRLKVSLALYEPVQKESSNLFYNIAYNDIFIPIYRLRSRLLANVYNSKSYLK